MQFKIIRNIPKSLISEFIKKGFTVTYKIPLPKYETHRLDPKLLPTEAITTKEEMEKFYRDLVTIRKFELASAECYRRGEIRGFLHLYEGQEATAVGIEASIEKDDYLVDGYRNHGFVIMRGASPRELMAEMMGKKTGLCKGKATFFHVYTIKHKFYGGHAIVGAQIPVGAGVAFALKYLGSKNIAITNYGDGAANQGQAAEAFNMAMNWKLPILYIVENNKYAYATTPQRGSANPKFYTRGDLIPGIKADGNNVYHMKEVVKFGREWVKTKGPMIIEADTYRYRGHSMADTGLTYRKKEEVEEVKRTRDPINYMKKLILDNKAMTEQQLADIDGEIQAYIDKEVQQARADPFPDPNELYEDVYIDNDQFYKRGVELSLSYIPDYQKGY